MQVRLLLGPAGSGKTFRCLSEARRVLAAFPEGAPLVLLAPKQGTYQLEQQLLGTTAVAGYARLSILSFESLARFILKRSNQPCPEVLSEEGRLMILRAVLARERENLKLFRASARLTGFAQQLSKALAELQGAGLDPIVLSQLASSFAEPEGLGHKLQDLALLLKKYQAWLKEHDLQDGEAQLQAAADCLRSDSGGTLRLQALWVDGFSEFSELELELLAQLARFCDEATVTFCLERLPSQKNSWLSHWTHSQRHLEKCRKRFAAIPGANISTEILPRHKGENRFSKSEALQWLEQNWQAPQPAQSLDGLVDSIRLVNCLDQETEVVAAAREVLGFVRAGGRYREASILARNLGEYQHVVRRVFTRYQIPFFLDQRQSVSHHPLAELTRSVVRLVAFNWQQQDWFAVLKSGLAPVSDEESDLLENEALARGWQGEQWFRPIQLKDATKSDSDRDRLEQLEARLEKIRRRCLPAFENFAGVLAGFRNRPTGRELAGAVSELWSELGAPERLEQWAAAEEPTGRMRGMPSVHETVWRQMNEWLSNAGLAFSAEALSLREWLPILEAGLANLSVGIIPPSLDQVLVGAVDRSRTPEVRLAIILELNEGVFPTKPGKQQLLNDSDREELERRSVTLGSTVRQELARENYLGYIACTRPKEKLVLTWPSRDSGGAPLNPSSIVYHVRELFPELETQNELSRLAWTQTEHPSELAETLLETGKFDPGWLSKAGSPALKDLAERISNLKPTVQRESLPRQLAARLYGPVLRTSVSRMEQFAACPFRFFVHSGLRAEERKRFELDAREQGTFQHDVLALFHQTLQAEGKRWRDLTPKEARERIGKLSVSLMTTFREGLLQASDQARFTARVMTESLQDFVEVLVTWMHDQYLFDPVQVELPFGEDGISSAWGLDLKGGGRLELWGRIDRVDLYRVPGAQHALCVIIDYKSSLKQLEPLLVEHGIQLQLLSYLSVIGHWPDPERSFGVKQVEPAGVFYVNLRGTYEGESNRVAALAEPEQARKLAYRHCGRFDATALPQLDSRSKIMEGDQFNYRRTTRGQINGNCREALASEKFRALLTQTERNLYRMGEAIYSGCVEVDPYRKGPVIACDQCTYQSICRVDPWVQRFRVLKPGHPEPDQP